MQYKTIIHELIQQQTELHEKLRLARRLLPTIESYAKELKASHEEWMQTLCEARPESDLSQIASEALEMAVQEMEERLQKESHTNGHEALSLDAAMAYIMNRTSRD